MLNSKQQNSGFTLIELMIVLVIVAILVAIAYPSYIESVKKSKRSEGKAAMASLAQSLERCFTRYNAYNGDECPDGVTQSASGHYSITINANADGYTLQANPNFDDSSCGTLTLNHQGVQSPDNDHCW